MNYSSILQPIARWHQTLSGLFVFGVVELALAYGLASLAIDRGGLGWYALAILAVVGVFRNFLRFIWKAIHGHKATAA
jgi:hypothetical protein